MKTPTDNADEPEWLAPWRYDASFKEDDDDDFPPGVSFGQIRAVISHIDSLTAELTEQCRLHGLGANRERDLLAKLERAEKVIEAIKQQALIWKCEAVTQKSTVDAVGAELGGIPDWGPIVSTVKAMRERLKYFEQKDGNDE